MSAFPATMAQEQLYYIQKLLGDDAPTYHVPVFFQVTGRLDAAAVRRSAELLAARHGALRTRFSFVEGSLTQLVDPAGTVDWVHDACADDAGRTAWIQRQSLRPFDLEAGPLFRAGLLDCAGGATVLMLCFHHIICDGWSVDVVVSEFAAAYEALADGRPPELPSPPVQYGDYAVWHREWMRGPQARRQLDYWADALHGDLPVLELPGDLPAPAEDALEAGNGAALDAALPTDAVERLRQLSLSAGATLPMALLAAYASLLSAYTGLDDIIVGVPFVNRSHAISTERVVGYFVNILAIRLDLAGRPTFTELTGRVRTAMLDAYDNQEVPFEAVVQRIRPARKAGRDLVFQALFMMGAAGQQPFTVAGQEFAPFGLDTTAAKFQISTEVHDRPGAPYAAIEYRRDLFSPAWMDGFAGAYARLLEAAGASPDTPVDELIEVPAVVRAVSPPTPVTDPFDDAEFDDYCEVPYVAPRDDIERELAEIWSEVTDQTGVGIDHNYFELGGDSIRSVQVVAMAAERGLSFGVRDLLLNQTIRELAPLVSRAAPATQAAPGEPFAMVSEADRALLPADAADAYPLTELQVGMLYHSQQPAVHPLYHDVATYRLSAPFSIPAWRSAIGELLARHELLRTSFDVGRFSEPLQIVHAGPGSLPVTFEDISALSAPDQDRMIQRRYRWERDNLFDWTQPPLMRFHLQKRSDSQTQLWITEHHAINDGWSGRMLFGELLAAYQRALAGGPQAPALPPPRSRYRSFVAAERQAASDPEHIEFWRAQLADYSAGRLPLGPETGRPDMRLVGSDLPEELSDRLTGLARRLRQPVRLAALAAHLRVMSLLSGTDDVVTGVVYNGRLAEPDGDLVAGLFLNTLPLRCGLTGTWTELIGQVAAADLAIQPHRRYPAARIQRDLGGAPPFEAFFNYTNFHNEKGIRPGAITVLDEDSVVPTSFPLGAEFYTDAATGRTGLGIRYDASRLSEAEAERIRGYYLAALRAMTSDPDRDCTQACLLADAELDELARWNDTSAVFDRPHVLHRLVSEAARRFGDRPAVVFEATMLSYRELDDLAGRLAARLARLGVAPRDRVGVCLQRSIDLPVVLLAVLKAGAAYVPFDPENPPARNTAMARDADVRLVLASTATWDQVRDCGREVQDVRALMDSAELPPLSVDSDPADPAYLIFTSGSTGRPKGVIVSHRAISNRLLWMQAEFGLTAGERVLQKTPYSFDVSVWEFFWPLTQGACLVEARPGGHREPGYLAELIQGEQVSTVHFVPSMLRAFLDFDDAADCTSLVRVICSGEALTADLRQRFYEVLRAELINLYGPTEAAVDVTCRRCRPTDTGPVTIGGPISNLRVHVLNGRRQPVPVGVTGELYIGGVGLADGYFGEPALTAERFPVHAWPDGRTERLYRTGDLARWLPGGEVEFGGRADHQLKIRGIRVEPGEIEASLATHPDVDSAVIDITDDRLVAYYVPGGDGGDPVRLREYLAELLPAYMVPTDWVPLERLPLSANGKLDRKQLPGLAAARAASAKDGYVEPEDGTERELARMWQEILRTGPVGRHDSFFELGGHSLTALHLTARIAGRLGRRLAVADLLANDTVARLAQAIDGQADEADDDARVLAVRRAGSLPPLWLIHPIGGSVFCYLPLARELDEDLPILAILSEGLATGRIANQSVTGTARAYVDLIAGRQPEGPVRVAGWSYGALLAYEIACQLMAAGREVDLLCMIDVAYPDDHFRAEIEDSAMALLLFATVMKAAGVPVPDIDEGSWQEAMGSRGSLRDKLSWLVGQLPADALAVGRGLDHWEAYFSVFTANLAAHNDYVPGHYPGRVHYVEGSDGRSYRSAERWATMVDGEFDLTAVQAEHYDLLQPPHVTEIANLINKAVGR